MVAHIVKEWYVMICVFFHHVAAGYSVAFPSILAPSLGSNSTDIRATDEESSWFMASYGVTGSLSYLIMPALMQMYGRRFISVLLNLIIFLGTVIIALAPDIYTLIIGRSIQGLSFSSIYVFCIIIAEYTHPKRRGVFIVFKLVWFSTGILICRVLGFTLTWRQTAWFGIIPAAIGAIGTMMWVESPSWLAYKGRFEDCASSFEWLRGKDLESRNELYELVSAQREIRKLKSNNKIFFIGFLNALRSKDFLKPFYIVFIVMILLETSSGYYLTAFMVQIMIRLTEDQSTAYYYIICLDICRPVAMALSGIIVSFYNRRTILFGLGSLALISLGFLCVFHYLDAKRIADLKYLTPVMLLAYYFLCNLSILPIGVVLKGELLPLSYRGVGVSACGVLSSFATFTTLKLTSTMLLALDVHGTFAVYLIITLVALAWLYFILPETKDRTLQAIELDFMDLKLPSEDNGENLDMTSNLMKSGSSK